VPAAEDVNRYATVLHPFDLEQLETILPQAEDVN
jgi:hypothetical protein